MIVCNRTVCKAVEFSKLIDVIPDLTIVGVENMGTVNVNIDAFHFFRVNIACNVWAFIDNQAGLAVFHRFMRKNSAIEAGADDEIIIFFHLFAPVKLNKFF